MHNYNASTVQFDLGSRFSWPGSPSADILQLARPALDYTNLEVIRSKLGILPRTTPQMTCIYLIEVERWARTRPKISITTTKQSLLRQQSPEATHPKKTSPQSLYASATNAESGGDLGSRPILPCFYVAQLFSAGRTVPRDTYIQH